MSVDRIMPVDEGATYAELTTTTPSGQDRIAHGTLFTGDSRGNMPETQVVKVPGFREQWNDHGQLDRGDHVRLVVEARVVAVSTRDKLNADGEVASTVRLVETQIEAVGPEQPATSPPVLAAVPEPPPAIDAAPVVRSLPGGEMTAAECDALRAQLPESARFAIRQQLPASRVCEGDHIWHTHQDTDGWGYVNASHVSGSTVRLYVDGVKDPLEFAGRETVSVRR